MSDGGLRSSVEAERTASGKDVTIVAFEGDLDLASLDGFVEAVGAAEEAARLVIDLTRVRFIDSSGIHGVVRARGARREHGLELIVAPDSPVARVLEMSGLTEELDPKSGRDAALDAFERAENGAAP